VAHDAANGDGDELRCLLILAVLAHAEKLLDADEIAERVAANARRACPVKRLRGGYPSD